MWFLLLCWRPASHLSGSGERIKSSESREGEGGKTILPRRAERAAASHLADWMHWIQFSSKRWNRQRCDEDGLRSEEKKRNLEMSEGKHPCCWEIPRSLLCFSNASCFHVQQSDGKIEDNTLIRQNIQLKRNFRGTATQQWIVQTVWAKVTSNRWQLKKAESQTRVTSSCSAHSRVCIINKTSFLLWQLSSCLTFALHSYSQQCRWCHTSRLQRVLKG